MSSISPSTSELHSAKKSVIEPNYFDRQVFKKIHPGLGMKILANREEFRMIRAIIVTATSITFAVVAHAQDRPSTTANFFNTAGEANGKATLSGAANGVLLEIEVTGLLPSQWVGF